MYIVYGTLYIQYNIHPLYFCTVVLLNSMKMLPSVKYLCLVTSVQSPVYSNIFVFHCVLYSLRFFHFFFQICAVVLQYVSLHVMCMSVCTCVSMFVRMSVFPVSTFDSKQLAPPSPCLRTSHVLVANNYQTFHNVLEHSTISAVFSFTAYRNNLPRDHT